MTFFGPFGLAYDSLAHIAGEVHLIVIGRVVGAHADSFLPYEGGGGAINIWTGEVEVHDVLKGTPRAHGLTLDVAELGWPDIAPEQIPAGDEVMLFLMNEAQQRAEGGYSTGDEGAEFRYWRPNAYQAVLRNVEGRVAATGPPRGESHYLDGYPFNLRGERFADIVERVREIVGTRDASYVPAIGVTLNLSAAVQSEAVHLTVIR